MRAKQLPHLQSWGTVIGGAILQNTLANRLPSQVLSNGDGAELIYSLIPEISDLPTELQAQVRSAFAEGLKTIWQTMLGVSGIGLLSCLLMREIKMQKALDETFGLQEEKREQRGTSA